MSHRLLTVLTIVCLFAVGLLLLPELKAQGQPHAMQMPAPALKVQASRPVDKAPYPTVEAPLSIRVIESPADAAEREARAAGSADHGAKDLDAQVRSANAAERQVLIGAVAAVLSMLGLGGLLWTLVETRRSASAAVRAAKAAEDAVRISSTSAEKQLRAYVNVINAAAVWKSEPDDVTIKLIRVQVNFKNTGQTPAHDVSGWMVARSEPFYEPPDYQPSVECTSLGVMGPGGIDHFECMPQFTDSKSGVIGGWKNSSNLLHVFGEIKYTDAFEVPRLTTFRLVMPAEGVGDTEGKFQVSHEGNKAH